MIFYRQRGGQHKNVQLALIVSLLLVVSMAGFWFGQQKPLLSVSSNLPADTVEQVIPDNALPQKVQKAEKVELKVELDNEQVEKVSTLDLNKKITEPIIDVIIKKEPEQKIISGEPKTTLQHEVKLDDNYKVEAVEGVSDDLLARFQSAIDETQDNSSQQVDVSHDTDGEIKSLTQMPTWVQNGVPNLLVEQHIYASNGQGWVKVNGRDRYQGDMITPDLQLSEILPQQIILIYRGEKFSLPALTNW